MPYALTSTKRYPIWSSLRVMPHFCAHRAICLGVARFAYFVGGAATSAAFSGDWPAR